MIRWTGLLAVLLVEAACGDGQADTTAQAAVGWSVPVVDDCFHGVLSGFIQALVLLIAPTHPTTFFPAPRHSLPYPVQRAYPV